MSDNGSPKVYLTHAEAAKFLGISSSALVGLRHRGTGPEFEKDHLSKRVVYRQDVLEAFLVGRPWLRVAS
jgi:hypothetical protein